MTPEEAKLFAEMLRRNIEENRAKNTLSRMLESRRREAIHEAYRAMGFDVVVDQSLSKGFYIDTTSRFVDIDKDFYERT